MLRNEKHIRRTPPPLRFFFFRDDQTAVPPQKASTRLSLAVFPVDQLCNFAQCKECLSRATNVLIVQSYKLLIFMRVYTMAE